MTSYPTLDLARAARGAHPDACCVIEFDHAAQGRRYLLCKAPLATLAAAIRARPMPDVAGLVAEHPLLTPAEAAAAEEQREARREHGLRENTRCERCGGKVDGTTAYRRQEWARLAGSRVRVTAWYCAGCRQLLGAVGGGEYSAMEARAADVPPAEPAHPGDD